MPIYEYACQRCGFKFEVLQRTNQDQKPVRIWILRTCPECGANEVKKIFSVFGFSAGGRFVSSSKDSGCSTCSSKNCSSCG